MIPNETLGALIRSERGKRGLSQEKLGRLAGLSAACVSIIERGKTRNPSLFTVTALLRELGLEFKDISHLSIDPVMASLAEDVVAFLSFSRAVDA